MKIRCDIYKSPYATMLYVAGRGYHQMRPLQRVDEQAIQNAVKFGKWSHDGCVGYDLGEMHVAHIWFEPLPDAFKAHQLELAAQATAEIKLQEIESELDEQIGDGSSAWLGFLIVGATAVVMTVLLLELIL